jgi:hypothetical protein
MVVSLPTLKKKLKVVKAQIKIRYLERIYQI